MDLTLRWLSAPLPGLGVRSFGTARALEGPWDVGDCLDVVSQPHHAAERVRADTFATVAQDAPSPMLRMGPSPALRGRILRRVCHPRQDRPAAPLAASSPVFLPTGTSRPSARGQTEPGPGAAARPLLRIAGRILCRICHPRRSDRLRHWRRRFGIRSSMLRPRVPDQADRVRGLCHTATRERDDHANAWTKDKATEKEKEESFTAGGFTNRCRTVQKFAPWILPHLWGRGTMRSMVEGAHRAWPFRWANREVSPPGTERLPSSRPARAFPATMSTRRGRQIRGSTFPCSSCPGLTGASTPERLSAASVRSLGSERAAPASAPHSPLS